MSILMIVQMQDRKIKGLLMSVKTSKTVSMVKSKIKNLLRLWMILKMEICENWVINCIYTNVIVMKMKINGHLFRHNGNGKGRTSSLQTTTWLLGTYYFWNITEGFVTKPLFNEVLPSRGGMMSTLTAYLTHTQPLYPKVKVPSTQDKYHISRTASQSYAATVADL